MFLIFSFKHFIDWPDFYSRKSDQSFVSPALHHRKALFAGSALISACHVFLHSGGSLGPSVFVKKTRFKVPCISFWPPIQFFLERKWSSMLVLLYSVNALPYTPSCQVKFLRSLSHEDESLHLLTLVSSTCFFLNLTVSSVGIVGVRVHINIKAQVTISKF